MGWKEMGDARFKAGKFAEAEHCYCRAIEIVRENAVLYRNRIAAYFQLNNFEKALRDAESCIQLRPNWGKGHFRKGSALEEKDIGQALAAYEGVLACNATDVELARKVSAMRRQVRAQDKAAANARKRTHEHDAGKCTRHRLEGSYANPGGVGMGPSSNSGWANGMSPWTQHEWLVDCYRMRVDDTMVYIGDLVGLYSAVHDDDNVAVLLEFLVFCKLALAHGVIPQGWDWGAFLRVATGLLGFAFQKLDAREKWGGDNVSSGKWFGVCLLRYTSEVVYGSSVMAGSQMHPDEESVDDEVGKYEWEDRFASPAGVAIFRNVGGWRDWRKLQLDMVYS